MTSGPRVDPDLPGNGIPVLISTQTLDVLCSHFLCIELPARSAAVRLARHDCRRAQLRYVAGSDLARLGHTKVNSTEADIPQLRNFL